MPGWLLPVLVLVAASVACYSDSTLWPYELTPTPLVPTAIPPPAPGEARFEVGDIVWVPFLVNEPGARLNLTTYPEPLDRDFRNKAPQSCSQNSALRILYRGVADGETIYYLVDCSGGVGWVDDTNLLGPLKLVVSDRALTTEAGADASGNFKIEASDPPYSGEAATRQRFDCKLNDTVDVIAISGFSTGELYYKIRCAHPFNPVMISVGWTTPDTLFGPVRFRNGESGLVPDETEEITLTAEPGGDDVTATCLRGELVTITDSRVQRLGDSLYYELECEGGRGWADQEMLVGPVPYSRGTHVMVAVPVSAAIVQDTPAGAAAAATSTPGLVDEDGEAASVPQVPDVTVSLTEDPEPPDAENIVGACEDRTLTTVDAVAGAHDRLYARVTCGEGEGWLESEFLYGPALYDIGDTVMLGEKALLGFNQRGIYLSVNIFDIQGPSGGSSVIAGECAFDFDVNVPIEAELTDAAYYRSSVGEIVGIFYKASCLDTAGSTVTGWINQSRIGE